MATNSSQAIELFLCYAREDEGLCQKLEKQPRALKRQGLIGVWHDRQIHPGTDWQNEINKHLNTAQIICSSQFHSTSLRQHFKKHNELCSYSHTITTRSEVED